MMEQPPLGSDFCGQGGALFGPCDTLRPRFFHQLVFREPAQGLDADEGGLGRLVIVSGTP
jgi:hypothetical protein